MSAEYELSVTTYIAASPETCWKVLTERLEEWWCPKPWSTQLIEMDLRPGGRSAMIMRGPEGEGAQEVLEGVFLDVIPNRLIVTTDAYTVGWVPKTGFMTGIWRLDPEGDGTRYTAAARHWSAEDMQKHDEMGFQTGWGAVAEQYKALCEGA